MEGCRRVKISLLSPQVNVVTKPSKALQQSVLKVFSNTIVAFYVSHPKESLSLSYHTMNFIFKSKIPPKIIETLETMGLEEIRRTQAERDESRESWTQVIDIGVMSGIQASSHIVFSAAGILNRRHP
jgi:hypothetical protein